MTQDTVVQGARLLIVIIEQCYIRLHLVDCVVARSATKLGGLGACPHSREASPTHESLPTLFKPSTADVKSTAVSLQGT